MTEGQEQELVNFLRKSNRYIPEPALVVELEGQVVGHITLTKFTIQADSQSFESLLLAPIAIATEYQNQAIGTKLIKKSLRRAQTMGYNNVIVVGNPAYYQRFGFRPATEFGIAHIEAIENQYVMVYALSPDGLKDKVGKIVLMPA